MGIMIGCKPTNIIGGPHPVSGRVFFIEFTATLLISGKAASHDQQGVLGPEATQL